MPPWNQWKWEEQQDDERWTLPSSGKTRSSRKWDWPSTPTEKSSTWYPQDNRDWQSPTGQGQETFSKDGLPNEFKPSREFLDSREVFGKTLLRRVASTAWSSKYSLAGREVQNIKLVDMIWKGYRNHHLRSLSHGHYLSLVVARKISEAVFASAILTAIREKKWDLDDVAKHFLQSHPELSPSKGQNSQEELKALQVTILAKEVISTLEAFSPAMDDKDKRIQELEQQLLASKESNDSSAMDPPVKRRRIDGKQSLPIMPEEEPSSSSMTLEEQAVKKALDPHEIGVNRILKEQSLNGVTKAMVEKWIKSLKKNQNIKFEQLQNCLALGTQQYRNLSSDTVTQLKDKLAQLGLPIQMAAKIKAPEIVQLLIAATFLAEV